MAFKKILNIIPCSIFKRGKRFLIANASQFGHPGFCKILVFVPDRRRHLDEFNGRLATQRRKDRVRHTLRATSQREELYKSFIEEASRLYADALVNDKSEVSKLVDLYALIARMKILSSDAVIEAAEKAARLILNTYLSPNRTFVDLPDLINEMDPLRDFSESYRHELQSAERR